MTILVIVESRAKAPKIEKMLGKGYTVRPCYGHVQDVQHSLKWVDGHAKSDGTQTPFRMYLPKMRSGKIQ